MAKRSTWLVTLALVASSLAIPGIAAADTSEAIADTGGMTLALPGVGMTLSVTLDQFGNIDSVELGDPATTVDPESTSPHRVRFELDQEGTRIGVVAKQSKLTSKVKAGSLTELEGAHTWSALLFPDDAGETTVMFTIGPDGEGNPAISGVTVDGSGGSTGTTSGGATVEVKAGGDGGGEAAVTIVFSKDGYTKTLKIKVHVDDDVDDDDGVPAAVLKVELRARDRQRIADTDLATFTGNHQWQGLLCDGTTVTVAYAIGDDGMMSIPGDQDVVFTPVATAAPVHTFTVTERPNGFDVRFDDSRARLRVKFQQKDDGTWELKVDSRTTETCRHDPAGVGNDGEGRADRHGQDGGDREKDKTGQEHDRDGENYRGDGHDD